MIDPDVYEFIHYDLNYTSDNFNGTPSGLIQNTFIVLANHTSYGTYKLRYFIAFSTLVSVI